ncbi:MAG: Crp/Fnr family transcriptional regulator [Pseudomonadota bacterium]
MAVRERLAALNLFEGIGAADLDAMAQAVRVTKYTRGQVVVETGETGRDVFFLLSGRLVGVLISAEGKEVAYADLAQGTYFGEMAAIDGGPRSLTVTAVTKCEIGRVTGAEFLKWLETYPALARRVMTDLVARNRQLNDRVFGLIVHDVEARVRLHLVRLAMEAGALKDGGSLDPAPTHSAIASHIGANREAVSRVMARFDKAQILSTGRQRIIIEDVDSLVDGL